MTIIRRPSMLYRLRHDYGSGFTLIELMVTLSVAAILLMIGVPNFRDFINNNRLSSQANDFVGTMTLARSEAIKQNRVVLVCPLETNASSLCWPTSGSPTPCCGRNWGNGTLIWVDRDNDDVVDTPPNVPPAQNEIIRVSAATSGNSVTAIKQGTSTTIARTGFNSSGNSTSWDFSRNSVNTPVVYTVCNSQTHNSRTLTLTPVGYLRTAAGHC